MNAPRIPIINLYSNLIVPIQGAIGDIAMQQLTDDVTGRIEKEGARGLVIDVSGVALMDSFITRNIRDLALTARLMGVATIVSGLQPAVAITLVEMGLEIHGTGDDVEPRAGARAPRTGAGGGGGGAPG